jgi:recombinational DNA repair protein RecR
VVKKNEVAERSLNEKRFCKKCEYYYSEFFTCPICYGEKRAEERILVLIENVKCNYQQSIAATAGVPCSCQRCQIVALIRGEHRQS